MSASVDTALIERAVAVLKRGGLVAVPTETVYGLAANADSEAAVRSVFAAKGRPADHPVIVHVADANAIDAWARDVPASARALAAQFWPGPLTLVLNRSARALDVVTGGQDTVGLRCPAHPWAQALLQAFAGALAAPSANTFGRISPTTAAHVRADLGEKPDGEVDLILDGGPCPVGLESTIVDLSGASPTLLRPGFIARAEIEQVLGAPVKDPTGDAPRASGRLEKHYAPRIPLEVVSVDRLGSRLAALFHLRVALLAPQAVLTTLRAAPAVQFSAPEDAVSYGRELYANLHRLDESGAERIVIAAPPQGADWAAIHDRLQRAQAGSRARAAGP
ncbi:MAG: L-threonylcarbamoyladenylate synthase [Burkholderiaceae bacterium]